MGRRRIWAARDPRGPTISGEWALLGWQRGECRSGPECSRRGLRLQVLRALERRGLLVRCVSVHRATSDGLKGRRTQGRITVWRRPYVDR